MRKFKRIFSQVPDPLARNIRRPLFEIIFIGLVARLCDSQHRTEMVQSGRSKEALLRQVLELKLKHHISCHDTFSMVFCALDPHAFEMAFAKFTKAFFRRLSKVRRALAQHKARSATKSRAFSKCWLCSTPAAPPSPPTPCVAPSSWPGRSASVKVLRAGAQ